MDEKLLNKLTAAQVSNRHKLEEICYELISYGEDDLAEYLSKHSKQYDELVNEIKHLQEEADEMTAMISEGWEVVIGLSLKEYAVEADDDE